MYKDALPFLSGAYAPTVLRGRTRLRSLANESLHLPAAYRLVVVREGTHQVVLGGHTATVMPGGVYLLPPGRVESLEAAPGSLAKMVIFIIEACPVRRASHGEALLPVDPARPQPLPPAIWGIGLPLVMDTAIAPTCADAIDDIASTWWQDAYQHHRANLRLTLLLATVIDHYRQPTASVDMSQPDWMGTAHRLIDERLASIRSAGDLAAALGLSPDHVARVFKRSCGETPAAYLRRRRRQRTAELLATTRMSVTAIAEMVGYRDRMALEHAWARHHDCPPLQWRRRRQRARP